MKEYKRCLDMVRKHLQDETVQLNNETLDKLVNNELQKSANEMDKSLIDLCLNALVAYRAYETESKKNM
ncbi:MAG: hypothetical protein IJF20_04845 [Clostridia bacterium]|nr:hypothetical protein [Clostridia bacterium]